MLSIRQLFAILSIGYLLLLFGAMVLIRGFWFHPTEQALVLEAQQAEVNTVLSVLGIRQDHLTALTYDHALHREMNAFLHSHNQLALDDHFSDEVFNILNINGVLILNHNNDLLYYKTYPDVESGSESIQPWLNAVKADFSVNKTLSNLALINNQSFIVASSPIVLSNSGPPAGWLILFQHINQEYLNTIADVAHIGLRIEDPANMTTAQDLSSPLKQPAPIQSGCLYDNTGNTVLCLNISHKNGHGPDMLNLQIIVVLLLLSLIPTAIMILVLKLFITPLSRATDILERSKHEGRLNPFLKSMPIHIRELQKLRDAYNDVVQTSRLQQNKLEQLSTTDRLTNLANRRAFDDCLDKTWRRIMRQPQSIALILVDIDYFKNFNDHYGHQSGDQALYQVAQALDSCANRSDELVSRFGGEEFVLIMQISDAADLQALRKRLSESIQALDIHHDFSPVSKQLTVSFGIAWIRDSGPWLESLGKQGWLRAADSALYEAKAAGRNCNMLQIITRDMPFTESPVLQRSPG